MRNTFSDFKPKNRLMYLKLIHGKKTKKINLIENLELVLGKIEQFFPEINGQYTIAFKLPN